MHRAGYSQQEKIVKPVICFLLLLCALCGEAAFAADNSLTLEQFQKIIDCQRNVVKVVNITNGQPLFDADIEGKEANQLVDVPKDERKKLIQQLLANAIPLRVHDNLVEWLKYKFGVIHENSDSLTCSQIVTLLLEGKTSTIAHVDVIDDSNVLSVQINSAPVREVVMPVEIKQDVVNELARKGVKIEHKPAKLDFTYILPGFLLGILGLGLVYLFIPMKLAAEVLPRPSVISDKSDRDSKPEVSSEALSEASSEATTGATTGASTQASTEAPPNEPPDQSA
jgi:hypothetical protein